VGVSTGGGGVAVASRLVRSGNPPAQLERISPIKINGIIFFIRTPLRFMD
jgi:hypothetical protein